MTTLLIITIASLFGFLAYIIAKYGILPSISDSFYSLKNGWIFSLVLWVVSASVLVISLMLNTSILLPIACVGIVTVGAAPRFKEKRQGIIHVVGAVGGIGAGLASMWVDFGLWYIVAIFVAIFIIVKFSKVKNKTWWVEVGAFLAIIVGIFIGKSKKGKE